MDNINKYKKKYLKYKSKIKQLKTQIGGSYNFFICFIWINMFKMFMSDTIKNKIIYTINKWKQHNPNNTDKILLFLDFDLTESVDIEYFKTNDIIVKNIKEDLDTIKTNPKIKALFEPYEQINYQNDNDDDILNKFIPLYARIDICKTLIMYDLIKYIPYNETTYVIMSDIDILLPEDHANIRLNCGEGEIDSFNIQDILKPEIINLLNKFGIIMAKVKKFSAETKPENNFMIAKNDEEYFKAVNDVFIEFIFEFVIWDVFNKLKLSTQNIYNIINTTKNMNDVSREIEIVNICRRIFIDISISAHFVYDSYIYLFSYICILKNYCNGFAHFNDEEIILNNENIYEVGNLRNKTNIIEAFQNRNERKNLLYNPFYPANLNFLLNITEKGNELYNSNTNNIYIHSSSFLIPTICVKIEESNTPFADAKSLRCGSFFFK